MMLKLAACALALVAAAPASADSRIVRYGDLDLTSAAGSQQMERRIAKAARAVCAADDGSRHGALADNATRDCISQAKARAMRQYAQIERNSARGG